MLVYGYFLLQGANLLSDGSELLLEVLDPGIVGGASSTFPCRHTAALVLGIRF